MRQIATLLMVGMMVAGLAACVRAPNPNLEFAQHAYAIHRGQAGQPVETVYYADENDRPRYRTYGIFQQREDGRWGITWADYGRVSQYRFEATHYPAAPVALFTNRADAVRAAEREAINFRFEVGVHTDPVGAPPPGQ